MIGHIYAKLVSLDGYSSHSSRRLYLLIIQNQKSDKGFRVFVLGCSLVLYGFVRLPAGTTNISPTYWGVVSFSRWNIEDVCLDEHLCNDCVAICGV